MIAPTIDDQNGVNIRKTSSNINVAKLTAFEIPVIYDEIPKKIQIIIKSFFGTNLYQLLSSAFFSYTFFTSVDSPFSTLSSIETMFYHDQFAAFNGVAKTKQNKIIAVTKPYNYDNDQSLGSFFVMNVKAQLIIIFVEMNGL